MSILRPLLLAVALFAGSATAGEEKPLVEIYLPSPCLACIDWGPTLPTTASRSATRKPPTWRRSSAG